MKRLPSNPGKFEIIRIADDCGRALGIDLGDASRDADILEVMRDQLCKARQCGILRHGLRVQAMFAHVAGAMGACAIIKEEDAGLIITAHQGVMPPDFRLVVQGGKELFVEVKSHRPRNPTRAFSLKASYVDALERYADLFGIELRIAVYWSGWGCWTLLPRAAFQEASGRLSITLGDAYKRSEMAQIGDYEIGTRVPLMVKFFSDPAKPRAIQAGRIAQMTIGSVQLFCAGRQIEDPLEKRIAWFLMLTCEWRAVELPPEIEGGAIVSFGLEFRPERPTPNQQFEMMGSLSAMISKQFTFETAPDGEVTRILPASQPGRLGIPIPQDYRGDALPLWRLVLEPNYP